MCVDLLNRTSTTFFLTRSSLFSHMRSHALYSAHWATCVCVTPIKRMSNNCRFVPRPQVGGLSPHPLIGSDRPSTLLPPTWAVMPRRSGLRVVPLGPAVRHRVVSRRTFFCTAPLSLRFSHQDGYRDGGHREANVSRPALHSLPLMSSRFFSWISESSALGT